jgi:hypothetical protein
LQGEQLLTFQPWDYGYEPVRIVGISYTPEDMFFKVDLKGVGVPDFVPESVMIDHNPEVRMVF